jgi:iron complex transport system substrate-binding protein
LIQYPQKVICLTEEFTEIISLLGREDVIAGISGFTVRPEGIRKRKPKVCTFLDANYDLIDEIKPDLVFAFSDLQADICRELIKKGYNVVCFNQRSVSDILGVIFAVGNLIGETEKAKQLVTDLTMKIELLKRSPLRKRPRVFFEEWDEPLISGIRWVEEIIEICGGENIFPDLKDKKLAKDRIVDPATVIPKNPDIIIGSWCGKGVKKEKMVAREGWEAINAVKNDRIYEIKSSVILQPGPAALTEGIDTIRSIFESFQ